MAWLAGKLDKALGMNAARNSNARQRNAPAEPSQAQTYVTLDFFREAITASLGSFAEVTESHLIAIEARMAALENNYGIPAASRMSGETTEKPPLSEDGNCLYPGVAATSLEAASKGLATNVSTKTKARRMRRQRQRAKACYAKEQLLQLRPVSAFCHGAGNHSTHISSMASVDLEALKNRVAGLEFGMTNADELMWNIPLRDSCDAESLSGTHPAMNGVPASVLALECKSARIIQKAWRRRRSCINQPATAQAQMKLRTARPTTRAVQTKSGEQDFPEWSPWLFCDLLELRAISQTCQSSWESVAVYTPFVEYGRSLVDEEELKHVGLQAKGSKCD